MPRDERKRPRKLALHAAERMQRWQEVKEADRQAGTSLADARQIAQAATAPVRRVAPLCRYQRKGQD
jgi:hypothetical protein